MKKIDSKQALLTDLRERIEEARVNQNMNAFDAVLQALRLDDASGATTGHWRGLAVNDDVRLLDCDYGDVSPMSNFIRSIGNTICISPASYADENTVKAVDYVFGLANEVIPESAYWVWRENARFRWDYKPAVFVEQLRTMGTLKSDLWWHFPHVSVEEPQLVAYTPSPDYGVRDRQVRVKIGRYLQQFYGDVLTSEQIRSMANGLKTLELRWATTADEMEHVYVNGPGSCMGGEKFSHTLTHPARVYASGDFKLAYLYDTVTEQIMARGLVSVPGNYFVRLYGPEEFALRDMLQTEGIDRSSSWDGERLTYIECDHGYVMPYLDGGEQDAGLVRENGVRYWRIGHSGDVNVYANETCGYVTDGPRGFCESCDEDVDEDPDDMEYSSYHGIRICSGCLENYRRVFTSTRSRDRDWVHEDDCVYCEDNDEYYTTNSYEAYGVVYCENSGDYRLEENCMLDHDGEWVLTEETIEVSNDDGDKEYVGFHDAEALLSCVYHYDTQTWYWAVDSEMYASAPRVMDDFGNEFVAGFFSPYRCAIAYGHKAAINYLRDALSVYPRSTYRIEHAMKNMSRDNVPQL